MSAYPKPLPPVDDPVGAPFWESARQHMLCFQRCPICAALRWPPAPLCPECLASGGDWEQVETTGTVWSFAVYDRPYRPEFADDIPYTVALVDLDAGPTLITNIVDVPDAIAVGARVEAVFDDVTSEVTLVRFRLVAQPETADVSESGRA